MLPRERFALVWLSALLLVCGAYFAVVALQADGPPLGMAARIGQLALALGALGVVAFGTWVAGRMRQRGAVTDDERDRQIEWRASTAAYHALMAGMIVVGFVLPFQAGGWDLVHAALAAVLVAEVLRHGLIVMGYRRGWRD